MYLLFIATKYNENSGAGDLVTQKIPDLNQSPDHQAAVRQYIGEHVRWFLKNQESLEDLIRRRSQVNLSVTAIKIDTVEPSGFTLTLRSDRFGVVEYKKGNQWVKTEGFSVTAEVSDLEGNTPDTLKYEKMPMLPEHFMPDWQEVLSLPRFVEAL